MCVFVCVWGGAGDRHVTHLVCCAGVTFQCFNDIQMLFGWAHILAMPAFQTLDVLLLLILFFNIIVVVAAVELEAI